MKLVEIFLLLAALFALEERDGVKSVIARDKAGDDASTGDVNETHGDAFSTRSKSVIEECGEGCIEASSICNESYGTACWVAGVENKGECHRVTVDARLRLQLAHKCRFVVRLSSVV